jgi:hypothetical protein
VHGSFSSLVVVEGSGSATLSEAIAGHRRATDALRVAGVRKELDRLAAGSA